VDNPSGSNGGNGSSDGSDNGSSRLNAQGGSDNGSGNQVSAWFVCERFRESFFWRPWTVGNIVGVLGASSVCLGCCMGWAIGGGCLTVGVWLQVCMQPVQVPRYNIEREAADGEEEGQATSQEKGANLGKLGCLVAVVTMHARCVNGPGRGSGVRTGRACRVV
jgi:hypothetical protein